MNSNASPGPLAIHHDSAAQRFEAEVEGLRCEVTYALDAGRNPPVMHITHTRVPKALEGRGLAGQLVAFALAHARTQGWKVDPVCSYVAAYMKRKPETQDLLV